MTSVRNATMDDIRAIVRLFTDQVQTWQRIRPDNQAETVEYDALTLYERWGHGVTMGAEAWMSIETGALLMSYLLSNPCVALVAVDEQQTVIGYLEAYFGDEPTHGKHLHIYHLVGVSVDVEQCLIAHLHEKQRGVRLTMTRSGYDREGAKKLKAFGFAPSSRTEQYTLVAQTGRGFYQVTYQPDAPFTKIANWAMPIGRVQSASTHWHLLWRNIWRAVVDRENKLNHHLFFSVSGHDAFVLIKTQLYAQRTADVYCWSAKPLTAPLLVAIRDWAYREGYRTLVLTVSPETAKLLPNDAEMTPYKFDVYSG
jgi:hypothetical protein